MATTVPNRDDWFEDAYGFPRPNWEAVDGWIRAYVADEDLEDAWQQAARHWVGRLRDRLGGDYSVGESENFVLLGTGNADWRGKMLRFLEQTRSRIRSVLGDLREAKTWGKHVVLRFAEENDYYHYVTDYHSDGRYAGSGGMFINRGYSHIAYPKHWSEAEEGKTLVHELTHNLLVHLPLPPWLNEALAMAFETEVGGGQEPLTRDLARRHREYWNAETIQEFWCGKSFGSPEGQELAYSLARVVLDLIRTELRPEPADFRRFVLRSDWTDAGAVAVREHLGEELENIVATFLGPGEWAPRRKDWKAIMSRPAEEDPTDFEPELEPQE